MKRKLLLSTVAVLLVVSLVIVGCAPKPAPPAAPAEVFTFKFETFWGPEYFAVKNAVMPTIKKMEEESNGRLKFDVYHASSLIPKKEVPEAIAAGVGDFGFFPYGYKGRSYPMEQMLELPYALPVDPKNPEADNSISWAIYNKYFHKEVEPVITLVGISPLSGYRIMTTAKAGKVTKLEDLRGFKFRSAGGISTEVVKALGGTPVTMLPSDCVEALSRGIIQGVYHTYAAQWGWGSYKYLDYSTDLALGTMVCAWYTNTEKLKGLPRELQEVITKNMLALGTWTQKTYWDAEKGFFPQMGIEEIVLSPQEKERWQAAMVPVWEDWMKWVEEDTGEDAKEMIKTLISAWEKEGYTPPESWARLAK